MHDWLVRLLLEVAVPSRTELFHVILRQLFIGRTDFDTSFDPVGGQWARPVDIPLIKDTLLRLRVSAHKIIKRRGVRLRAVSRERQIMVLEVQSNTRQLDLAFYACLLELRWVTNARALENQRCAERPTGDDNLLAGTDDCRLLLSRTQWFHGNGADGSSSAIL